MAIFSNTDELHRVMHELWSGIKNDPKMASPLLASKLTIQFVYREPEGRLTIDCSDGSNMYIFTGECERKAVVEMFMKSDVAHEFWLGKVNVPMALLQGRIVAKGPVQRALQLLPAVKPAHTIYQTVIINHGVRVEAP
jgi:hypothetical protein